MFIISNLFFHLGHVLPAMPHIPFIGNGPNSCCSSWPCQTDKMTTANVTGKERGTHLKTDERVRIWNSSAFHFKTLETYCSLKCDCSTVDTWENISKSKPTGQPLWLLSHSFCSVWLTGHQVMFLPARKYPSTVLRDVLHMDWCKNEKPCQDKLVEEMPSHNPWDEKLLPSQRRFFTKAQDRSSDYLSSTKMWHQIPIISFCESTEWQLKVFLKTRSKYRPR